MSPENIFLSSTNIS